ncbi:minor capsid protein [Streptomyces sp. NPDC057217]|uniref:minor capsid protein n=1 Tax=Streptomyces sp. NPDC057217 TaxID=3346054 RepID=UPI0036255A6F
MADLADGLARVLDDTGLLTYDPTALSGDTFIGTMPAAPDEAVALTLYDAGPTEARDDAVDQRLQVRVRGGRDPRISERRARAIYEALHGLTDVELADGTFLILIAARGLPAPMGVDSNRRHEHVVNFDVASASPITP